MHHNRLCYAGVSVIKGRGEEVKKEGSRERGARALGGRT